MRVALAVGLAAVDRSANTSLTTDHDCLQLFYGGYLLFNCYI